MGSIAEHQALLYKKLLYIQSYKSAAVGEELMGDSEPNNDSDTSAVTVLTKNSHLNTLEFDHSFNHQACWSKISFSTDKDPLVDMGVHP